MAAVANIAVWIVFKDYDIVRFRQFGQLLSPFLRQRNARRVLECRDGIDKFRMILLDFFFYLLHYQSMVIHRARNALGSKHLKNHRTVHECRIFHQNNVARIDEYLTHEIHRFQSAGGNHDVFNLRLHAFRRQQLRDDDLAQVRQSLSLSIRQGFYAPAFPLEYSLGNTLQNFDGQRFLRWRSATKRD